MPADPPPQQDPPPPPPPADPPPADPVDPASGVFQPGFHLALRHSHTFAALTTVRHKVAVTRGGKRLKITFRAGDGAMRIERVTIGRSYQDTWRPPVCPTATDPNATCAEGKNGGHYGSVVPGTMKAVTFDGGKPGFSAAARERVTSDPIEFPVAFREEIYVTFEVSGAVATSAVKSLEQSYWKEGAFADRYEQFGSWNSQPVALSTIAVEGPRAPVMVAIGDSITEGYIKGAQEDLTGSWPYLAGRSTNVTTVNAAVSGDGIELTLANLDEEVFVLEGVTDCMVLIGTNDISSFSVGSLTSKLTELYKKLEPFCRVWGATMPPKDETGGSMNNGGSAEWVRMHETRNAVNSWIKSNSALTGVFDFSPGLTDPARPNYFLPSLTQDGIHPNAQGYQVMAKEAAKVISAKLPR